MGLLHTVCIDITCVSREDSADGHVLIRHGECSVRVVSLVEGTGRCGVGICVTCLTGSQRKVNFIVFGCIDHIAYHKALVVTIESDATNVIRCCWCGADSEAGDIRTGTDGVRCCALSSRQILNRNVVAVGEGYIRTITKSIT